MRPGIPLGTWSGDEHVTNWFSPGAERTAATDLLIALLRKSPYQNHSGAAPSSPGLPYTSRSREQLLESKTAPGSSQPHELGRVQISLLTSGVSVILIRSRMIQLL